MTSSYWNPAENQSTVDWNSSFSYTPTSAPSVSTAYDTSWTSLPSWSSAESYPSTLLLPLSPSQQPFDLPPSPSQQPFDWGAAIAASKDLMGGIANLIAGIRGVPVGYGGQMAGSNLADYLQSKKEDTYLKDLLESLRKGKDKDDTDPRLSPLKTSNIFGSSSYLD